MRAEGTGFIRRYLGERVTIHSLEQIVYQRAGIWRGGRCQDCRLWATSGKISGEFEQNVDKLIIVAYPGRGVNQMRLCETSVAFDIASVADGRRKDEDG